MPRVTGTERPPIWRVPALPTCASRSKSRNAARFARSLGLGGGTGLGGIVYALTVMATILATRLCAPTREAAADLVTDELIAADKQLDVIGGAAGAILGLLRLYRDTRRCSRARARAKNAASILLAQSRLGAARPPQLGRARSRHDTRSTACRTALPALPMRCRRWRRLRGRDDFAEAASECIAFENASYDDARHNWPDLRGAGAPSWPCQWCHGAPGIGLARIGAGQARRDRRKTHTPDIEQRRRRGRARLAEQCRYAVLRHARQRRIPLRGRRRAATRRSARTRGATAVVGAAELRRLQATTAGTAAGGNSISACSAALPASATRRCARPTRTLPNVLIWD